MTSQAEDKFELLNSLICSHRDAAMKNEGNISTMSFINAYAGSGDVIKAIAAALLSTGGLHAPIRTARLAMRNYMMTGEVITFPDSFGKEKYPGVGHSFYKDSIDPSFRHTVNLYDEYVMHYDLPNVLQSYTRSCCVRIGKSLPANAAGITAAVAIACELQDYYEVELFISGRVRGWLDKLHIIKDSSSS